MLRQHGESERYKHQVLGYNFRLTDLAAAIGLPQLHHVDAFNASRRKNAQALSAGLQGVPGIIPPVERAGYTHVYHQYTVRVTKDRDRLRAALAARGIGSGVYYPIPVHRQPVYVDRGYGDQSFSWSEQLAREVLSLPVHPAVSGADIKRIVQAVSEEMSS
jgi:dTDP-4-amino-4,6-dideoxygalactose transaminase